ncbi:MAG TPA: thermonuclease family protein [Xanthobacteraceae bacterium]|nr:thermonuclease family protein [Xanthobacteraceae bacterium]
MKLAALLLALALSCIAAPAAAEPIEPGAIGIVDGDTITVRGYSRHVRLLGFDTPETGFEARCSAERAVAAQATQRLRQIVAGGGLDLTITPCKCWQRRGMFNCNAGRYCGVLKANGRDVSTLMIGEGLARPAQCGKACRDGQKSWC